MDKSKRRPLMTHSVLHWLLPWVHSWVIHRYFSGTCVHCAKKYYLSDFTTMDFLESVIAMNFSNTSHLVLKW